MNAQFKFYENGVEKIGNFVFAMQVDNEKYILYELEENPNNDVIYAGKYFENSEGKLELLKLTEEESNKVKIRIEALVNEIEF